MGEAGKARKHPLDVSKYALVLAAAWTLCAAGLLLWDARHETQEARELVRNEADAHFLKDQAFRLWGASHGGVYVPPTERTPPNPYLAHIPDRDIETLAGKKLTLMDPAYMVRQLMEEYEELYGVKGRITSMKPLRPENAPDTWERAALESFERGETEAIEFTEIDGEPYLRLMRPMMVEKSCLKCHAQQGYKEGDVRGGVGVSVPAGPLLAAARARIIQHGIALGLIWLLGLAGMALGTRRIRESVRERERSEKALRRSEIELSSIYENAPLPMLLVDSDRHVRKINASALAMARHAEEEVIGLRGGEALRCFHTYDDPRGCGFGPSCETCIVRNTIHDTFKTRQNRHSVEAPIPYDAEGGVVPLWVLISTAFLEMPEGEMVLICMKDITDRKRAEEQIATSLREKEVLLREIHHRVKNNMQVIVGLLRMHSRRMGDARLGRVFDDCRDRVNAMSLIHEALYQSEDLARIDFGAYLTKLCGNLSQAHGALDNEIAVKVARDGVSLGMDQGVAVGMVICELVSNAFKHAFPEGEPGLVSVSLSSLDDGEVELTVQDDGIGLLAEIDIQNSPSLGLELAVAAVTGELGGSIEVERGGGTRYTIRFKCKSA